MPVDCSRQNGKVKGKHNFAYLRSQDCRQLKTRKVKLERRTPEATGRLFPLASSVLPGSTSTVGPGRTGSTGEAPPGSTGEPAPFQPGQPVRPIFQRPACAPD
eukprot:2018171-Amphidinium_carterae.1